MTNEEQRELAIKEIIDNLDSVNSKEELEKLKYKVCRKYKVPLMLNADILSRIKNPSDKVKELLTTKPIRSLSGVSVVAVMTKPFPCPHGKCVMCPQGKNAPQSYTGKEPATMRAIGANYDPTLQVKNRIRQLELTGHPTDKIEVIVMGGTFTSMPRDYTTNFVKGIFDGLNGVKARTLEEAHMLNEESKHRCVGLTIETRPDYCFEDDIRYILSLGATRVEIGVQSTFDDVLKKIKRGHTVQDSIKATQLLKDSSYKINYHMMTGLPGSNPKKDLESFKTIFQDQRFKPDMIKIYPTMVIKGTELYDMWKRGEYEPYSQETLINLLADIKRITPRWVRIMRIQRDIPLNQAEAGVLKGNIREILKTKVKCNCIRCREVGHKDLKLVKGLKPKLFVEEYRASNSKEFFISFESEDQEVLFGFIRLRIPYKPFMEQITKTTGLIRELHVYGKEASLGKEGYVQHKGLGRELLEEAESIAKSEGMDKMVIISGVGVRPYFKKLGYRRDGPYMSKSL